MYFAVLLLFLLGTVVSINGAENTQACNIPQGIEDGRITDSMIKVSSSASGKTKDKVRFNCCNNDIGGSWCPDPKDKAPYLEINLTEPKAISGIQFQHPVNPLTSYGNTFMKSFDLQFKPALSLNNDLIEFNQNIPAIYNESTAYTVGLNPTIVTNTIRILPRDIQNNACFRMELLGCEPTGLCTADFCKNGGKCVGPTLCQCSKGFFGRTCEITESTITTAVRYFTYLKITTTTIKTTAYDIHYYGKVELQKESSTTILKLQPESYLTVPTKDKCFENLATCYSGFTYAVGISFQSIPTTAFYILKGGDRNTGSSIELTYSNKSLICTIAASASIWQLSVHVDLKAQHWYRFEVSWSQSLGLTLLQDGKVIGNVLQPALNKPSQSSSQMEIQIGYGITNMYKVAAMRMVPVIYSESIRAGITEAVVPTTPKSTEKPTTAKPTTMPTTAMPTTEKPCKKNVENSTHFQIYNLTFSKTLDNKIITPDLDIKMHGNLQVVKENGSAVVDLQKKDEFLEVDTDCIMCMSELTSCTNGFTIQIAVHFHSVNKSTVFDSGIKIGMSGFSLVYEGGKFTGVFQTGYNKWLLNTDYTIRQDQFYTIQLSWSQEYGLRFFINNYLVDSVKPITLRMFYNNATQNLIIGKDSTLSIKDLMIWTTTRDILVQEHILPEILSTTIPTTPAPTTPIPTTVRVKQTTENSGITEYEWTFASITSNKLINHNLEIEIKGNLTSDKEGVYLTTNQQYLEVFELSKSCTGNLALCSQGLTFEFEIKFFELIENTVIMTTGGENPNNPGVAVVYRFGQIQVVVTTITKSWYATIPNNLISLKQWHKFLISWTPTGYLQLYLNDKYVTSVSHYVSHLDITATYTGTLYIGHSFSASKDVHSINCIIQSFHIWHLTVDILIDLGLVKCQKPTKPTIPTTTPTTTATPTKSTQKPTTPNGFCPVGCISIDPTTPKPTTSTPKPTTTTPKPTTTTPKPTTTTPKPTTTPTTTPTPTLGIPTIDGSVTLTPIVDEKGDAHLSCKVQATISSSSIQLKYSYTILDKTKNYQKSFISNTFENRLSAKDIDENILGKKAYCTVTARYLPDGRWSEVSKSNVFVAVIELKTTTTIKLIEGQKAEYIDIKTNVPPQLLCPTGNKGQCHVQLVASITANKECRCSENIVFPQLVIGWKPSPGYTKPFCGSSVTVGNWEGMIPIPVKATVDGLYDKDMYRYVHVVAVITGSIIHKTETHDIGKVKVQIYNRDYKATCGSVNDPHITSFDGLHYNNFQTGEYILYRHKTLPYEVRAYYKPCSSRRPTGPSCNCGVAVRSGDDVITLTGCASGSSSLYQKHNTRGHGRHHNTANPITIKMFKNGQLTPGTRIRRLGCGQKYEVLLPSGTYVTVQSSYLSFINIWITASSMDYEQTGGLCGVYNRNKRDDLTDISGHVYTSGRNIQKFLSSWRSSVTIFTGVMAITDSITQSNGAMYCSCVIGYDQYCTTNMDIFRCAHKDKYDITEYIVKQAQLPHVDRPITGRRRRALPDATTTLMPEIGTNMTLTEKEAEEICNEYLNNSTAVSSCENITQLTNYTQNIVNCVYDLHATGDEGFATSHIDDIVNQCVAVAKADVDQYTRPNLNETTPTQKILTTLCPEKCGQNGQCEAGVCVCDDGFTGATCEVGKSTKPEIIPVSPDNEPCDINTRNCSEVDIMGINFVESADLSCHYQPVVVTDKIEVRGASSTMKANFISTYQIGCPLPYPASSAYIGISNDGHTVSDVRYLHLVHDSKCFECFVDDEQNAHCNRKKEICYIDGVCQAAGQLNPTQKCQICDPAKSQLLWSSNTDPVCMAQRIKSPPTGDDDAVPTAVIALAAACGVLGFILIISFIVICKQRSAANTKKPETGSYDLGSDKKVFYDNPDFKGLESERL